MGRQAHLTRLALGRSPYGPLLRDENGDIIVGPHTHDDDAIGYVQQFNERGHPASRETDLQNRKLHRAQNEVLKLAGVVRSKHDVSQTEQWKSMSENARKELIVTENNFMRLWVVPFDSILLDLTTSWISAFRNRLTTYESYLTTAFISMLRSEVRTLGLRETLFSGLPLSAMVNLSRRRRTWLYSWDYYRVCLQTPRSKYRDTGGALLSEHSARLLEMLWFAVEWPYSLCASLQCLHLLPSSLLLSHHTIMSVLSVFLVDQSPGLPRSYMPKDIAAFCISCLGHPLVLSYLLDQLRESVQSGVQAIIRSGLPVPDEPDHVSGQEDAIPGFHVEYLRARIAGFGWARTAKRRYYGPESFAERVRMAFPQLSEIMYFTIGFPAKSKPHLTPDTEESLQKLCELRYGVLWRENRQCSEAQRLPDSIVRRTAVIEALAQAGINPVKETISIDDWARDAIPERSNEGSTATPPPPDHSNADEDNENAQISDTALQDLLARDTNVMVLVPNQPGNAASEPTSRRDPVVSEEQSSNAQESATIGAGDEQFEPTVPLETLLLPMEPESQATREIEPPTPNQGITRALSLEQAPSRLLRRPTDIGQDVEEGWTSFPNRTFDSRSVPEDAIEEPDDPVNHRVTILSNYPAETFALHTGALVTSIIMLPFDMYYQRMIARTFLGSSRVTNRVAGEVFADVWPTSPWLGLGSIGVREESVLIKNLVWTYGLQALVSSLVWRGVKHFTLQTGRQFGWGKI